MNLLRYAFKNIFRNLFLSISSILIISLLVFFVNILLFVLFATEQFIASVNDRISLTINLREGFSTTDIRAKNLLDEVQGAFTGISLTYISREEALDLLSARNPSLALLVENSTENPLPNSLKISGVDIASYTSLNNYIARYQDILQYNATDMDKKLLDYKAQFSRISVVVDLLKSLELGVIVLLGLFLFTVFSIVHMIIRNFIYFLQDEVEIIELVGGSPSFIYGPFVFQGIFYTGCASGLALFALYILRSIFSIEFISGPFSYVFQGFFTFLSHWSIWEIIAFIAIGALSSLLASRRYIHSTIGR
ncbi:permease-like cell division protein FtsX [Candidatus Gracilibacteria bacterium]|nr:permease-like cell division protein FtsX [Candidatus Gracilibacteria bacterium]